MAEYKKQHYVPQFYLRSFSKDNKNIYCYNMKQKKSYLNSIKNMCQEKHFYGINKEIEISFSQLENRYFKVYKKVIEKKDINYLTPKEFNDLLTFILFQYNRTKDYKVVNEKYIDWFVNNIFLPMMKAEDRFKKFPEEEFDNIKITWPGGFYLAIALSFLEAYGISDLRPALLINSSSKKFITSDAPVVKNNYMKIGNLPLSGTCSSGLQIIYPLSPDIILFLFDNDMYKIVPDDYAIILESDSDIESLNKLQAINCFNNIFHSDGNESKYIYYIMKKYSKQIKEKKIESYTIKKGKNKDGTFSEIIMTNFENISKRARFSFLRIKSGRYFKMKSKYKILSRKVPHLTYVRNQHIADEIDKCLTNFIKSEGRLI